MANIATTPTFLSLPPPHAQAFHEDVDSFGGFPYQDGGARPVVCALEPKRCHTHRHTMTVSVAGEGRITKNGNGDKSFVMGCAKAPCLPGPKHARPAHLGAHRPAVVGRPRGLAPSA